MAKPSALEKVIRHYLLELERHQRAVEITKDIIDRLREQQPVRRPRVVKKNADEKTA
jgi:hypothetical protein